MVGINLLSTATGFGPAEDPAPLIHESADGTSTIEFTYTGEGPRAQATRAAIRTYARLIQDHYPEESNKAWDIVDAIDREIHAQKKAKRKK